MKLTWCTDVHLDFVSETGREAFYAQVKSTKSDAVVVTGDIAESQTFPKILRGMAEHLGKPIYFVLGNHDYYDAGRSFRSPVEIQVLAAQLRQNDDERLRYLSAGLCEPTVAPGVALVGVDGWYDGRYGTVDRHKVWLNDFEYVPGLRGLSPPAVVEKMRAWADDWARELNLYLGHATYEHDTVFVATHVPPYRQASTYRGKVASEHYAPFFVSKATGDVLDAWAEDCPEKMFVVLCGHTHGRSVYSRRDNLVVLTGEATYRKPRVAATLDTGDWKVGMPRVRATRDLRGDWTDDLVPAGTPGIIMRQETFLNGEPDLHVLFANDVHFATLNHADVEPYAGEW